MVDLRDNLPDGPVEVPEPVRAHARGRLTAVWRNELGGLTFRDGDRYLKWSPAGDLAEEARRIAWAAPWTPVPEVLHSSDDLLITRALPGESAVSARWRAEPAAAVTAIAEGLRAMHETLPVAA